VDELGRFLELEAVVMLAHDEAACRRRLAEISGGARPREADFIRASYAELLRCDRTCEDGVLGPVEEGTVRLDQQSERDLHVGSFCLEVCGSLVESVAVPSAGSNR